MVHVEQAIVVEGRYDKNTLSQIVDTVIFQTNGFSVMHDRELLALLRGYDAKLTGRQGGETHILNAADVLYADTADKKTFLYTADAVYETPLRLYELEEQLAARDFVRAGKSVLLNFAHVAALRPDFGGRMRVTMSNGEVVVASRQYVPALKAKLGL